MFRHMFNTDVRGVLPTLSVPTLVVHRAGDRLVRVDHGRFLAENIPGALYRELSGDDHAVNAGEEVIDEVQEFLTGARSTPAINRVLATVLLTDIVGSTDRATAIGDRAWRELLDRHDAIVLRQLQRHRGRLVKSTGDGILATFDGPARAISCARELRDALRPIGLDLRAGIHTGEIELRGSDVAGVAIHIAARVSAVAGAGEVVVSRIVTDLVTGSGIRFADRGENHLKGVPGSWRLFTALD
jgi:class 3 adenylate cyclase